MNAQLITYQVQEVADIASITDKIKTYTKWAKLIDNSWIILTDKSSGTIRDELREAIGDRGKIFVVNVSGQSWGSYSITKEVTDWLKTNLS